MKISEVKGKYWTILITLLILSLGLISFFFIYAPNNEAELNESCYRDLNRITKNLKEKTETYKKNAGTIVARAYNKQGGDTCFLDSAKIYIEQVLREEGVNKDLKYIYNKHERIPDHSESRYLKFIATGFKEEYIINDTNLANSQFTFTCPIEKFINPLFESSIFDGYLIYQQGNSVLNSIFPDIDVDIPEADSSDHQIMIKIGGIDYIAYKTRVNAEDNVNNYTLYGLISKSTYDSAKYCFQSWFLFLIIAGLLIILLSIPIIKLISLSPIEELDKKDAIFIFISVCLGSSVFLLLLLSLISNILIGHKETNKNLITLSEKIEFRFLEEIDSISVQLDSMDNYLKKLTGNLKKGDKLNTYVCNVLQKQKTDKYPVYYKNMKLTFWMDSLGEQKVIYSILPNEGTYSDLSHRDYFKNVMEGNMWVLPGNDTPKDSLFLESIYSVSSGKCLAAISKKSDVNNFKTYVGDKSHNLRVIAITSPLNSLINTALPYGTQFCIIHDTGKVLFHSDKNFNLQEDFLVESHSNSKILSAIYARTESLFTCRYHNKLFWGYVQPIQNMPLQLVTLYDKEIANSFNSQVFSLSFIFVLVALSVLLIQSIFLFILNRSKKRSYKSFNLFNWFKYSNAPEAANNYRLLVIGNSVVILIVLCFNLIVFNFEQFTRTIGLASSITASVLVFAFNYYVLSGVKVIIRFLPGKPAHEIPNKKIFLLFSFLCLLVMFGVYVNINEFKNTLPLALLIIIISGVWFSIMKFYKSGEKLDGLPFYYVLLLSWIIIFTMIPSANSFKIAYNFEQEIALKHKLFASATNYYNRKKEVNDFYKKVRGISDSKIKEYISSGFYTDNFTFCDTDIPDTDSCEIDAIYCKTDKSDEDNIIAIFSPRYSNESVLNRNFIFSCAKDSSWKSKVTKNSIILYRKPPDNSNISFKTTKKSLSFTNIFNKQPFLSVILFMLFILFQYFLLRYLANKLFGINLIPDEKKHDYKSDDKYDQKDDHTFKLLNSNPYLFVVGISGSGKNELLSSKHEVIDMKKITPPEIWEEEKQKMKVTTSKPIVLDTMEYDSFCIDTWNKKLLFLKDLYRTPKHIIILSQIHPDQILTFYEKYIDEEEKKSRKLPEKENKLREYRAKYIEWQQVLDRYIVFYQPLTKEKIQSIIQTKDLPYENFVKETGIPEHQLLHNYYYSIWRTIPLEEKYILHDYAKDGFINSNNKKAIVSLARKGLLVNKGSIATINESFRDFIVTILKPEDELNRTKEILIRGRWNTFRIVLLLIIIALFTLLWYGNQKIITDFKAILVSLAAIATLLLRFGKRN